MEVEEQVNNYQQELANISFQSNAQAWMQAANKFKEASIHLGSIQQELARLEGKRIF